MVISKFRLKSSMFAVLFVISPFLAFKSYACSNESSWAYNQTDNTCVKQWLPVSDVTFKSYDECLDSRILSITYIFGAKYTGTYIKIPDDQPPDDLNLKGKVFATSTDLNVVGYPVGGVASDYFGSSGSIGSVSKAELDALFCRDDSKVWWEPYEDYAIKNQVACYEKKIKGTDLEAHKKEMSQFLCTVASAEKHFTHTSGGRWWWDRNYTRNRKKTRVDCFSYLVDTEPSCGIRGCPLAAFLPNPCGDNPPPDDDCPDLTVTIRGTLLPARRGTARVSGDWCN